MTRAQWAHEGMYRRADVLRCVEDIFSADLETSGALRGATTPPPPCGAA